MTKRKFRHSLFRMEPKTRELLFNQFARDWSKTTLEFNCCQMHVHARYQLFFVVHRN